MERSDKHEILEAIQSFATAVDERFDRVDQRSEQLEGRMIKMESRMTKIEAAMVTKDYLDDKLANLHSDIVNFVKKRVPCWSEIR